MILEDRLTRALRSVADGVTTPEMDLAAVRSQARSNRLRAASVAAVTAVTAAVAVIVASTTLFGGRDSSAPLPASNPRPSTAVSTTTPNSYTSSRYGFTIIHPPGWTKQASTRDWSWEADVRDWRSPAHETFFSPDRDIEVGAWSVPLSPGTIEEASAYLQAWVEDYCQRSGYSPCTGIADRAVELCLDQWDCHAGLLVPFGQNVHAFFVDGIRNSDAMTVVAVWRPESEPSVYQYGGSRKLLERFLAPMGVRPSVTPIVQREGPP